MHLGKLEENKKTGGVSLAFISPLGPSQDSKIKQKSQKYWRPRDRTNPLGSLWAGLSCGIQISQDIKDLEPWKLLTRRIPRHGLSKLGLPYTAAPTEGRTVPTCQDWGCARTGAPAAQSPPPPPPGRSPPGPRASGSHGGARAQGEPQGAARKPHPQLCPLSNHLWERPAQERMKTPASGSTTAPRTRARARLDGG